MNRLVRVVCATCDGEAFRFRERDGRSSPGTYRLMVNQAIAKHGQDCKSEGYRFFVGDKELGTQEEIQSDLIRQQRGETIRKTMGVP